MKKCEIHYTEGDFICFQNLCQYLLCNNSLLRKYNQFEILPYLLHFSEVLKRILIIKYCVG